MLGFGVDLFNTCDMVHDALQQGNTGTCIIQAFPKPERWNFVDQNVQFRVAKILLKSHVKYLSFFFFLDPTAMA